MNEFKGWQVLGASFTTAMLVSGATFYAFQYFVTPVEKDLDLSREQVNYAMMIFLLSAAIWAALMGKLLQNFKPKFLALLGIVSFSSGLALLSQLHNPVLMLGVIAVFVGFGFTACGPFMANALTTVWFYKHRGRALGIAAVATSVGGFVGQPVVSHLVDAYDWRTTLLVLALSIFVLSLGLILKLFIRSPEDIGQFPDGASESVQQTITSANPSAILKNRDFWIIAIACGLLLGSDQALLISLKPFGDDLGLSNSQATLIPWVVAGSAVAGKLMIGWLAERYDKRLLFLLVCASNIAFLLVAILAPYFWSLLLIASVAGIAIGGIYPVWTSITADTFGREYFAVAIGLMNLITVIFALIGMGFIGRSHDTHGDYFTAFKVFIPVAILAGIVMMFVRTKRDHNA